MPNCRLKPPTPILLTLLMTAVTGAFAQDVWEAPPEEAEVSNPMQPTDASIARGKQIYRQQCATCHGEAGLGDGPSRQIVAMNPPNLADAAFAAQHTDGDWFWKISTGRDPMMPFEATIPENDRWHVVNYIRTLSKAEGATQNPHAEPPPRPKVEDGANESEEGEDASRNAAPQTSQTTMPPDSIETDQSGISPGLIIAIVIASFIIDIPIVVFVIKRARARHPQ